MNDRRAFVLRRLFSASGVFPLGVFVVYHLVALARLTASSAAFEEPSKLRSVIELLVIGLPLAFHAVVGAVISISSRPNVGTYPFRANWSYTLMRVTGLIALIFLVAHLWQFRVRVLIGRGSAHDFVGELVSTLSSTGPGSVPYVALAYLIGLAATTYHLAVGVQGFCASFGLVRDERTLRRIGTICTLAGLALFAIGASSVIYLATGVSLFGTAGA